VTLTRRAKRRLLIALAVILIVIGIMTGLIPTTIPGYPDSAMGVPAAKARAGRVITDPRKITSRTPIIDIRATVRAPHMSTAIARRLIRVGRPRIVANVQPRGSSIVSGNSTNGCAGTVVRTKRV